MKISRWCLFLLGFGLAALFGTTAFAKPLPRVVLGLYDSSLYKYEFTSVHQFAEMPLNHLGLIVKPIDISKGLPSLRNRPDIRGVLTWFPPGYQHKNPIKFLQWARHGVAGGKRFVILGEPGFRAQSDDQHELAMAVKQFFEEMGIKDLDEWTQLTYNQRFSFEDPEMMHFERLHYQVKPPFERMEPLSPKVISHLVIRSDLNHEIQSHLIMTGPKGGYAADGYALFFRLDQEEKQVRRWYINPFEFFRQSLGTDDLPKPDTTTLAGSRIFYSHIDGDGWNNVTSLEEFKNQHTLSADVIYQKALKTYPDIPVSVSAIAADLDLDWSGTPASQQIAKKIFALPQVEIGSHTYSHPFDWSFFASGDPEKERPFLHKYKGGGWDKSSVVNGILSMLYKPSKTDAYGEGQGALHDYDLPRAFAHKPFDIDLEITGSTQQIEKFAPPGKKVKIVMWSGDTTPFETAVRKTREAGLFNINGGDSRMDRKFPSYAWVSPIGRSVGNEQQIYSSNSNENTYTDLWTGGFHGFRYLANTVFNTEQPIRLKPFNIYYHMYSGEKEASFLALQENIELAKKETLTRIWASQYSQIGQGFYQTQLTPAGTNRWSVANRGALNTIRFDHSSAKQVNYRRSKGVIGHHYYQGSLYVYLDRAVSTPIIALKSFNYRFNPPAGTRANLDQATWQISQFSASQRKVTYSTHGFGQGTFSWRLDPRYHWKATRSDQGALTQEKRQGRLFIKLSQTQKPVTVTLTATSK